MRVPVMCAMSLVWATGCQGTCGTHSYATTDGGIVHTEDCSNFGGTSARRFESLDLATINFDENTASVSDAVSDILDLTAVTTVTFRFAHLEEGSVLDMNTLAGTAIHDPTASGALPLTADLTSGRLEILKQRGEDRFKVSWDLVYGDEFQTTVGEKWLTFDTAPISIAPFERPPDYGTFTPPSGPCDAVGDRTIDSDEALRAALPLCTLDGTLTLTGAVTDLTLLDQLESVGSLVITGTQLTSLDGLEGLRSVGDLSILDNTQLTSMDAVTGLTSLGSFTVSGQTQLRSVVFPHQVATTGDITVSGNIGAHDLVGLEQLTAADDLEISGNPALGTPSDGAPHGIQAPLVSSVGRLRVFDNPVLAGLDLSSLTTAGDVEIGRNALPDLAGLASLTSADSVEIASEPMLSDLSGLAALATVEGSVQLSGLPLSSIDLPGLTRATSLDIRFNAALTEIDGFEALTELSALFVNDNTALGSLGGFEGLDHLATLTVRGDFELSALPLLATLDSVDTLTIEQSAATQLFPVGATLQVHSLQLQNNGALQTLGGSPNVTDELRIDGSPALTSVALGSAPTEVFLTDVGLVDLAGLGAPRDLTVFDSPLGSLAGLETASLESVTLQFTEVTDLDALLGVTALDLHLENNPQLTSLTGLAHLSTVGTLVVRDAPLLTAAPPFESLVTADQIWIERTGLTALPDFPALESVTFDLHIEDNPELLAIEGLDAVTTTGRLVIRDNPVLQSLSGLNALSDAGSVLEIRDNPALCQSHAQRVADLVTAPTETVSGNLDGC